MSQLILCGKGLGTDAFTDAKWLKIDANQIYHDVGDASAFYCDVKGCGKKKILSRNY
jgi:hypothetical protein